MIDYARITVRAGNGGRGAGTFTHIKGKRYGKADGGSGGGGGNVYMLASVNLNSLEPFRFVKNYQAENGQIGLSNQRHGADGEDLVIKVPVGTSIVSSQGIVSTKGQTEKAGDSLDTFGSSSALLFDLVSDGQKVLVARGGEGGRGNSHLRDEFGRRPRSGEQGQDGEFLNMTLELKLIADVGLIGLPNAGKSTLLAAITSAKPKIAPYPFTTLEPNLGVMNIPVSQQVGRSASQQVSIPESQNSESPMLGNSESLIYPNTDSPTHRFTDKLVIADIPGLIEGASVGRGLGDLFLRHIERTRLLVHLIDIAADLDKWQDYQTIRVELKAHSKELAKKKEIIVLNKVDLVSDQMTDSVVKEFKKHRKKIMMISASTGEGIGRLIKEINNKLKSIKPKT